MFAYSHKVRASRDMRLGIISGVEGWVPDTCFFMVTSMVYLFVVRGMELSDGMHI